MVFSKKDRFISLIQSAAEPENYKSSFSSNVILAEVKENMASESSSCLLESKSNSILFNNLLKNFNT